VEIRGEAPKRAHRLAVALGPHRDHVEFRADIKGGGIGVNGANVRRRTLRVASVMAWLLASKTGRRGGTADVITPLTGSG
jgi:hypothetical protein